MCFHNPGRWLAEAIVSVICQPVAWELILIDDASTDESVEIAQNAATNGIRYYRNEVRQGIGYSKKRGCELTSGEIIAIVDGDDVLERGAFEKVLAAYREDFRRRFVYTTHMRCDAKLQNRRRMAWVKQYPIDGSIATGTDVVSAMLTFQKSLYDQTEGYTAEQKMATDKHLVSRFEELTLPHFVNDAPYLYRVNRSPETIASSAGYYAKVREWAMEREAGISIIIPYYNRKEALGRAFQSLNRSVALSPFEVILSCWKDCDITPGDGVRVLVDTDSPSFSRGRLLNRGAMAAKYRRLFVMDADMTIDEGFFLEFEKNVGYGRAWFPICRNTEAQPNTDEDMFLKWGYGMVGITKRDAMRVYGWPEYSEWGAEDDLFFYKVRQTVTMVLRSRWAGLVHHAHGYGANHADGPEREARRARLRADKIEFDRACGIA
jgi:glycosyltransferase involved in cell wall biosynthesis